MPLIPLYGHHALRERLLERIREGALPQSLLLHGPAGIGKQRLALWMAQALLCERDTRPCGECRHCRYALELTHPDLRWVFPRPRGKESDPDADDIASDLAEANADRAKASGLYAAPSGSDGIHVAVVRYLVHVAAKSPALATKKVFVVGDADRMVQQEGSEFAANAFLKLLEEPPANTWIIMTTSAANALLPTIRSRVVSVRVPRLDDKSVREFLLDTLALAALAELELPDSLEERITLAQGAPGVLLSSRSQKEAMEEAKRFLDAALGSDRAKLLRLAFVQGHRGARGAFSDLLDALTVTLHQRMRDLSLQHDEPGARSSSRAIDLVEEAKLLADGNVNPQLIAANLLTEMSEVLA